MRKLVPYDRLAAVLYAHRWAYRRNPSYYDFSELGGDCTNFASQCLYAGAPVMNFTQTFGWYYKDLTHRAPAWTGVPYFWNFLTRKEKTPGPVGVPVPLDQVEPGDFIQMQFRVPQGVYSHSPIVVSVGPVPTVRNILVAAHSDDTDFRPLSSYRGVTAIRCIHIAGAIAED